MIDLDDIRQDIFDIKTVPKVLYVYRGDTFEVDLDLTISSAELDTVVLNCDGLPEATALTLLETTAESSKWHLVLNKMQTLILTPKSHNFTITVVRTDGTELTLYKGIMTVNNRVYSNYSNNYYIATLLKQNAPTVTDNDYLIGTMWVNVLTNRVYFLTSVVNNEAKWLDYAGQLQERDIRMDEVLDGTAAFTGVKIDDGNGNSVFMRYTHTNDNHYQVVDIIYPDGRVEQINEQFDNNFRNVVDLTLNSGHVLMSNGVTQGQQVVDAKLFDETSQDAYNVLGVVTVDGITKHSKSKATSLGIVTGIQSFFSTGIPYTEGQTLWARQGLLSNVAPSKPGLQVRMGILINTQGSMDALICPHIFGKLADSSDVDMAGVQEGDVIEKRGELYKPTNRVTRLEATRELLENKAEDFTVVSQTKYPTVQAVKTELNKKVDKTTTIIGLDLQNNISLGEFMTALGNATQSVPGLLSPEDKTHYDALVALLETSDGNNVVDTIGEILAIFQNYPEGADLVTALAGKVDKVVGMGLSKNDFTDLLKSNYDTAFNWGDHSVEGYLKEITKAMVEAVLSGTIISHDHDSRYYTEDEIDVMLQDLTVEGHTHTESDITDLDKYTQAQADALLNSKVDKVAGKGLSTNDYTTDEKNKLAGIASGAEVNTVDSVNGQTGVVELDAEDVGALPDDTPLFSGDYDDLSNKPTIDQLLGNLSALGFVKRTGTNTYMIDTSSYQPLDADLTSIAGLSGTSGLLKKTASNTWQLDTSVYLTEITKLMVEAVLTGTITTHTHNASDIVEDASNRFVTDVEKAYWDGKQDKLVAGANITIDENTNEISASGGGDVSIWRYE